MSDIIHTSNTNKQVHTTMTITRLEPVISTTGIRKILDNQGREIASVSSLLDGTDNLFRSKESEYVHNAICDSFNHIAELEAQKKRLVEALESITSRVSVRIDDPRINLFDDARALLAELSK